MKQCPLTQVLNDLNIVTGFKPKPSGNGYIGRCPAHDDTTPSLSVSEGGDGRVLLHCFAGCSCEQITDALGMSASDLFLSDARANSDKKRRKATPSMPKRTDANKRAQVFEQLDDAIGVYRPQHGEPTGQWTYHDADGQPAFVVVRFDRPDKSFRPIAKCGGGWLIGAMDAPRPLYRLRELLASAGRVYVCEGEKATEAVRAVGLVATTSAGGSNGAALSDWSPLADREVVILPDNDATGRKHAKAIVEQLAMLNPPAAVRIVELPERPDKGDDFVEYHAARQTAGLDDAAIRDEVEQLADAAEVIPPESCCAPIESDRARHEFAPPVPLSQLGTDADVDWLCIGYVARGFVSLFTGLWKAGKTTFICHLLREFENGGTLVGSVKPSRVLIVSEENQLLWARRRDDLRLGDHVLIDSKPFKGRASASEWTRYIEHLAEVATASQIDLVIFDTIAAHWPVVNENDASEVTTAVTLLNRLVEAEVAVLIVHHPRKGDATEGQAARGSGALSGYVDILIEMRRANASNKSDTQRVLTTYSRFDETPPEMVIELRDGRYVAIGSKSDATATARLDAIDEILTESAEPMSPDDVLKDWPVDRIAKPGKRTIQADLTSGSEAGRWTRIGRGVSGDPFKYSCRASSNSYSAQPDLENKSEAFSTESALHETANEPGNVTRNDLADPELLEDLNAAAGLLNLEPPDVGDYERYRE